MPPCMRHRPHARPRASSSSRSIPRRASAFCRIVAGFVGADAVAVALATRIDDVAGDPGGRRHRHQRRGAPGLARASVGVLRPGRPRARGRADPPRDAGGAGRHRPRRPRRRATSRSTRSARPPPRASAARASSTPSPRCSTRASSTGPGSSTSTTATGFPRPCASRVIMRGEERARHPRPSRRERRDRRRSLLTQDDIRQVQLCKGAIASGAAMLQHVAGVSRGQGDGAHAGGRLRQLPLDTERAQDRPHPRPARVAHPLRRQRRPHGRPARPRLGEGARGEPRPSRAASSTCLSPPIPTSRTSSSTA